MTDYFVSPLYGNDANNGLGADPTDPTNKPWATVRKGVHTGSTISNAVSNRLYLSPGIHYSLASTVPAGIASTANPLQIIADPLNVQGFKDSGGVRLATGPCLWTRRTSGEGLDARLTASGALMDAVAGGTKGIQLYGVTLEAGDAQSLFTIDLATNTDWVVQDCTGITAINWFTCAATSVPTAGLNLTMRGNSGNAANLLNFPVTVVAATADANLNVLIENNIGLLRPTGSSFSLGTAAGNKAGGITIRGNGFLLATNVNVLTTSNVSTVVPIHIGGNLWFGGNPVVAGALGEVIDDGGNAFCGTTSPTNMTQVSPLRTCPLFNWPTHVKAGLVMPDQPWFGWGPGSVAAQYNDGWAAGGSGDFWGRTARPWGGGASRGPYESGHLSQGTDSAISGGGATYLKITGAGEGMLFVAVDAVPTTITITTKSSGYGGTSWAQIVMQASPDCGVAAATATATSAAEQTLTIGPFTPTVAGVVELRPLSRSTSGVSTTAFDILAVSV